MKKEQVLKKIKENTEKLRQLGVKRLSLFGSCARGEASKSSDLDFVVEFKQKSFDSYMETKIFLEDLFQCKIDLVLKDSIKSRLRSQIFEEMVDAA